jgi:hypothetical protein
MLFAFALVGLAAGGCGGSSKEAEIIKGKPMTGGPSVTRSVAWIEAHRGQHPAPSRSAESRPEAADTRVPGSEAATKLLARANVQEKPEPGEEGGPPKRAASSIPLQRTGRAAIEPKSSLDEGTSFLGADSNDSGFIPPDSMGSVGPTQIIVDLNGVIRVFDKQTQNVVALDVSDSAFWAPVLSPGAEPTDPGVEYDRNAQRWIISAIDTKSTNNRVMLAVSDGPEITAETDFTFYFFNEATPLGGTPRFADYPQLAVDANAVYIGVNLFTSSSGTFAGTAAYVIRKSSVTPPSTTPVVTGFPMVTTPGGAGMDSPQPATDMDPTVADGYFIGADNQFLNRLDVQRITDPGGTPAISSVQTVTVPTTSTPLPVPANGATGGLDALDDRLFEAMIGRGPDGTDTLWTAQNIRVNSSGAGSSTGDRDAARWYQIGDLGSNPPSLIQSGTLFDTAATNPRFFWMPSIAMNGQGHASLNASTAGPGRFAEIASSAHLASDPLGTTQAFDLTQSSNSTYNLGSASPKRWGDYSQTVVDPTDDQTFWTFQEYVNSQNSWGVRVIQLKAPPPATPAAASPNTILPGQASVPVTITGTSTDGSGFFDTTDPGPPYPAFDHISASVSGGVIVNSVTYTDPTHVTLDLDTTAATTGAQTVTITNPDGQSTSCVPLVIGTDTDAPSAPNPQNTTPGSPANNTNPRVFGSNAECGSTVDLYTDSACTNLAATGSSTDFSSPGLQVTVPPNSSTSFWATATDVANNTSACSTAHATYVEDSAPPVVSVTGGPTGATTDTTPTFTFSATDTVGPVTVACSIDTGAASFRACSGPGNSDTPSSPLSAGSHTFRVQATDAAGNTATAARDFTVQIPQPPAPPDTAITKGPKKKTTKRRPKFKFTSTQAGSTFQCKLDKGPFAPCTSPFVPPKLSLGKHVLKVKAIGPTGVADPSVAIRKFTVAS